MSEKLSREVLENRIAELKDRMRATAEKQAGLLVDMDECREAHNHMGDELSELQENLAKTEAADHGGWCLHLYTDGELEVREFDNKEQALSELSDIAAEDNQEDWRDGHNDAQLWHDGVQIEWSTRAVITESLSEEER